MDLNLTEAELAAITEGCQKGRRTEAIAAMESAAEDYDDADYAVTTLADGVARRNAVRARFRAERRVLLYAGMAEVYRPTVDVDQLAAKVVEKLKAVEAAEAVERRRKRDRELAQQDAERLAAALRAATEDGAL